MTGGARRRLYCAEPLNPRYRGEAAVKRRSNTISGSLPGGEVAQRASPRYDMDSNVRHPNQARDPDRSPSQLDARACPTWPLRLLPPLEWLALERVVELDALLEDDIDAARELLLDESPCDGRVLLPSLALIEPLDFGVVLNGPDRGVTEGELEVTIPVLAPAVTGLAA